MWVVAGVLLGIVVLATLVGLHTGPHTHVGAVVAGVIAAAWLAFMAVDLNARALVVTLLAADVVVSGGVGLAAWRALSSEARQPAGRSLHALEGKMGVAQGPLSPDGVVRVRGESWSATSLNGPVPDGGAVQVISVNGIRLGVWGEEASAMSDLGEATEGLGEAGSTTEERPRRGAGTGGLES